MKPADRFILCCVAIWIGGLAVFVTNAWLMGERTLRGRIKEKFLHVLVLVYGLAVFGMGLSYAFMPNTDLNHRSAAVFWIVCGGYAAFLAVRELRRRLR